MSADKTRAEVWADMIETQAPGAAAELRRLSASEAAMINLLGDWVESFVDCVEGGEADEMVSATRAALKAAKEARND